MAGDTSPMSPEDVLEAKAANSRAHRAAQTTRNLVWALVATLLVVLALVLVVVRPDMPAPDPIDYQTIAGQSQSQASETLVTPVLPEGWNANRAQLGRDGDVESWYIGFVTPSTQFVALTQGIGANSTWVDNVLERARSTGSVTIDGVDWVVYDNRDTKDPGNRAYALVTSAGNSTYVLYGTASDDEFALLAQAIGL